jgi:hypothetical protein
MKQKYFEKKVLNQKEIDEFWNALMSGNREKGVVPMAADIEPTKKFVGRINEWLLRNQRTIDSPTLKQKGLTIHSIQYNENLSECVVVYER